MKLLKQFSFLLVMFSGFVLANDFFDTVDYFFGDYGSEFVLMKLVLWFVLFAVLFWSLFRVVFEGNRFIAGVVAFVIATVGVRFIPDEILEYIGQGFYIFILVILLIVIILIPKFLSKVMGVSSSKGKFVLYLLVYGALVFGVFFISGSSFDMDVIFNRISDFLIDYPLVGVLSVIIFGIYAVSKLSKS